MITKKDIRDYAIIVVMSSLGTIMWFISWTLQPENLERIKQLIRM